MENSTQTSRKRARPANQHPPNTSDVKLREKGMYSDTFVAAILNLNQTEWEDVKSCLLPALNKERVVVRNRVYEETVRAVVAQPEFENKRVSRSMLRAAKVQVEKKSTEN
jgi:hypothetical protein